MPRPARSIVALLCVLSVRPPVRQSAHDVFTIMAAFDRIVAHPLWPGFDPAHVPIAIFDGHDTFLFRHPKPPAGFSALPDHAGVFRYRGRHESLRANTQVVIGGERTATVIINPARVVSDTDQAAIIVHEAFHLFQAIHHPGWQGNEGDMLTYPLEDTLATRLQRLETEALRQAVAAQDDGAACWSRAALELRTRRFAQLPPASGGYEQRTELNEGLATYVEYTASGKLAHWNIAAQGFGPDQVRLRAYSTGPALGALLDRLAPGWQERLDGDSTATLDGLLRSAVQPGGATCDFTPEEVAAAGARAVDEVRGLQARTIRDRTEFLSRGGWTLEVVVDSGEPLWPQAFDPWNIERMGGGELLHGRWLRLGNKAGTIEVLDRAALTEPAGKHPLFNGVRRLVVSGLAAEPKPIAKGTTVRLHGEGVDATLQHARVDRTSHRLLLHLTGGSD